ncbi:hypothetical protein HDV06_002440 [Boothiomyces sp. JEL0866]|nr:hypothetical protein HDV06_002440 [Boothiomyces sp. JEL0866]
MYPWGYSCSAKNKDATDQGNAAKAAVAALKSVNGLSFTPGDICNTIYQASGSSADWAYGKLGIKYAFAVELRPNSFNSNGFVLSASNITPAGKETLAAVLAAWKGAVVIVDDKRFLTNSLPSMYHPLVKSLLGFRNNFTNPYLPEILFKSEERFVRNEMYKYTRWTLDQPETDSITSIDKMVTLTFDRVKQLFTVRYPYPLHMIDSPHGFHYGIVKQFFTPNDIPMHWEYPSAILLSGSVDKSFVIAKSSDYVTTSIPTLDPKDISPSNSLNSTFSANIINHMQFSGMKQIKIFRNENIVFIVSSSGEIQIILVDATLKSDADFNYFVLHNGTDEQDVYRVDSGVQWINNRETGAEYPFRPLVSMGLSLYQNHIAHIRNVKENIRESRNDISIKDEIRVPAIGLFTMFQSGSVRGKFVDGTIIEFPSSVTDVTIADVLDHQGTKSQIRVMKPIGYEDKIKQLLDFQKWCDIDEPTRKRISIEKEYERKYYRDLINRSKGSLDQASGSSADWAYGKLGIKYAFAVELRPNSFNSNGFVLSASNITPAGKETLAAVLAAWKGAVVIVDDKRFLTNSLPSMYHPLVKSLLGFRNNFTNPYLPEILFKSEERFVRNEMYKYTRWTLDQPETDSITSIDKMVTLTFDRVKQLFTVRYPYPLHMIDSPHGFHYGIVKQFFTPNDIPMHWEYPSAILLSGSVDKSFVIAKSSDYVTTSIPTLDPKDISPSNSLNSTFSANIINHMQFSGMKQIKIFRNENIVFIVSSSGEIQIILVDATLKSDADFNYFVLHNGTDEQDVYRVDSGVQWINNRETGAEYPFRPLVSMGLSLYQNHIAHIRNVKENIRESRNDISIKDEIRVPAIGLFTMFQSGSVRGKFVDGTIIEFPSSVTDVTIADVLDHQGTKSQIRVMKPIGYEDKIKQLLDFQKWCDIDEPTRKRISIEKEYERKYYRDLINRSKGSLGSSFEKSMTELLLTMRKRNLEFLEQSKT